MEYIGKNIGKFIAIKDAYYYVVMFQIEISHYRGRFHTQRKKPSPDLRVQGHVG